MQRLEDLVKAHEDAERAVIKHKEEIIEEMFPGTLVVNLAKNVVGKLSVDHDWKNPLGEVSFYPRRANGTFSKNHMITGATFIFSSVTEDQFRKELSTYFAPYEEEK